MENITEYQKAILQECIELKSGGISVPMGAGKTLIALVLGLEQIKKLDDEKKILVIVSKTLISSWEKEIKKFFGKKLKYIVLHQERINMNKVDMDPKVKIVLTTPETTSKYYKELNIENTFITRIIENEGAFGQHEIIQYNPNNVSPFCKTVNDKKAGNILYSTLWGALFIDEAQQYTKINTDRSRSIAAICAKHRWCLSGTLFTEPSPERILGYHMFINDKIFPRTLPDTKKYIKGGFKGFNRTLVKREALNLDIEVIENVIYVEFGEEEKKIYLLMRKIILDIHEKVQKFKEKKDVDSVRKFNGHLLGMVSCLRECLSCPIIPLAILSIDLVNLVENDVLGEYLPEKLKELKLEKYLNNPKSIESERFKELIRCIKPHDKIIIFGCFRTVIDVLIYILEYKNLGKKIFTITGSMTSEKRQKVIDEFNITEKAILIFTYKIGAEGLNLQSADTAVLLDVDWSYGITKQAMARILRQGQLSKVVYIYHFVSNSGIEKAIYEKQTSKCEMIEKLSKGATKLKKHKLKMNEIIQLLESEENIRNVKKLV